MNAFHAYDIIGIYNKDFNKEDAYAIGYYLPDLLDCQKILIGRDVRDSTPEIFDYLTQGITDRGAAVYDLGLSTTPLVYWATAKYGFDASVMITASHNPKEYNGMKISKTNATPVGYDSGLNRLEKMILSKKPMPKATEKGEIHDFDIKKEYLAFLSGYSSDFSALKTVIDCSNGMASLFVKEVLGNNPIYLYDELDGSFPNHEANPLDMKNIVDLQDKVKAEKADIGIIFDGDADRVMFVDENGAFISPDLMIAFMGHYFFERKKMQGKVIQDIRSSKAVGEYLSQWNAEMETWRVGRAYAAIKLREIDGLYGGELAGHYYFKDFYYSDSAFLACLIILDVLKDFKKQDIKLSEIIDKIKAYHNSGEINFRIENKKEVMDKVKEITMQNEKAEAFYDFDGYRVEFKNWWYNIRPSNTEPYLRLLLEAGNKELLHRKKQEIISIINNYAEKK
jgi:phosphomannomutase